MVNSVINTILEGVFPNQCSLCGLRSYRPLPLCCDCETELQRNSSCCHRCAIPLPPTEPPTTARLCGACLRTPPPYQRVIAPWLYCERLAYLIRRWKFQGDRKLTPLLASLWLQQLTEFDPVDVIIPVPLHWWRLWRRGFNQSELLSRQLLSRSGVPLTARLDHRSVRRCRPTSAQSGMGARQRNANLRGAFTVRNRYDNLRIAVIDDVLTTGGTAAAMATALHRAGADHIEVWCLARTPAPAT